jgi:hypothetical protein
MDFAENYSSVVQDEVQGFHWAINQPTVHPFVVYYKDAEEVKSAGYSSSVISGNMIQSLCTFS